MSTGLDPLAFTREQIMTNTTIRHFTVAVSLALTTLAASAAYAADAAPAVPVAQSPAKPVASVASTLGATGVQPGLTRDQVREDLKRYQREHANPSYAELVFLR